MLINQFFTELCLDSWVVRSLKYVAKVSSSTSPHLLSLTHSLKSKAKGPWRAGLGDGSQGFLTFTYSPELQALHRWSPGLGIQWGVRPGLSHIKWDASAAAAKSLQSCPTLCNPTDGSPPGSPVPGILQARTLEWVAISFFNAWKWKVKVKSLSRVRLFVTPWTAAYQAPLMSGIKTVGWLLSAEFPWLVEEAGGRELMHMEFFAAEIMWQTTEHGLSQSLQ